MVLKRGALYAPRAGHDPGPADVSRLTRRHDPRRSQTVAAAVVAAEYTPAARARGGFPLLRLLLRIIFIIIIIIIIIIIMFIIPHLLPSADAADCRRHDSIPPERCACRRCCELAAETNNVNVAGCMS